LKYYRKSNICFPPCQNNKIIRSNEYSTDTLINLFMMVRYGKDNMRIIRMLNYKSKGRELDSLPGEIENSIILFYYHSSKSK